MAYERVNWENLPSTKTPVNADNLNKMDEGIANAVEKTGDTMTGDLLFENKNDYAAIRKTRTLNGTDYQLTVGVGENGSARMEYVDNNDAVLSSVEARSNGIYNGVTGKKLVETNEVNFVSLVNNSKTFSFSIGTSTGGYFTYIIYGGWAKHFMYLLTVHPNPENKVIGYNQIFNNTGEANITNVTISNNIITITFSSTIWGGIHIIGKQAQST